MIAFLAVAQILISSYIFLASPASCKQSTITIKAENGLPSPITKTATVDIACAVDGLRVQPTPTFSTVDSNSVVVLQSQQELLLIVTIQEGSFVNYKFLTGDGLQEQNKDDSSLINPAKQVTFKHKYTKEKTYDASILVNNSFSSKEMKFKVKVQDCPPARLTITGSPVISNPTVITTGEDYSVIGSIEKSDCAQYIIEYTAFLYNISSSPTQLDTQNLTVASLKYTLLKDTRSAGQYKITFMQAFNGSNGLEKTGYDAYVTIKQSDLVANIASGTSRKMPATRRSSPTANTTVPYDFTLDASGSFDPDSEKKELKYSWLCRQLTLPLPALTPEEAKSLTCHSSVLVLLEKATAKIPLSTAGFQENKQYEFVVRVRDGNRVSNYTQKILFLPGAPPQVEFECVYLVLFFLILIPPGRRAPGR